MHRRPQRGDLRVARPAVRGMGECRLTLVLAAGQVPGAVEVALVHPYGELATSSDGVVPGRLAGTPYDVVVQSDLRGLVHVAQLSGPAGRLEPATIGAVSEVVGDGDPEAPSGVRCGLPLVGPFDRRWAFKAEEGRALDWLTSAATAEVLGRHRDGPGATA